MTSLSWRVVTAILSPDNPLLLHSSTRGRALVRAARPGREEQRLERSGQRSGARRERGRRGRRLLARVCDWRAEPVPTGPAHGFVKS